MQEPDLRRHDAREGTALANRLTSMPHINLLEESEEFIIALWDLVMRIESPHSVQALALVVRTERLADQPFCLPMGRSAYKTRSSARLGLLACCIILSSVSKFHALDSNLSILSLYP